MDKLDHLIGTVGALPLDLLIIAVPLGALAVAAYAIHALVTHLRKEPRP